MNTWRLMMGFAAATGLVLACSSDPEKSEDDSGDGGSATTTTTTGNGGATTTTTTTTTTVASTTTGQTGCDTGAAGTFDFGAQPCQACAQCAAQGACAPLLQECPAIAGQPMNTQCDQFFACVGDCDDSCADEACFDECVGDPDAPAAGTCFGDFPDGADDYFAFLSCVVCQECPNNCDGVNQCM